MKISRSHELVVKTVKWFLILLMLVQGGTLMLGSFNIFNLLSGTEVLSIASTNWILDFTGVMWKLQYILGFFVFFAFLVWVYMSTSVLRRLSGKTMSYSPGWAVGWFLIPIAHYFMPYAVMVEIRNVSHGDERQKNALVNWWFLFWILWAVSVPVIRIVARGIQPSGGASFFVVHFIVVVGLELLLAAFSFRLLTDIGNAMAKMVPGEPGAPLETETERPESSGSLEKTKD